MWIVISQEVEPSRKLQRKRSLIMTFHRRKSTAETPRTDEDNQGRLKDLESCISNLNAANAALEEELQRLHSQDTALELANANARIVELEAELASQTQWRGRLEEEIQVLRQSEREARISELESELVKAAERREDLERRIVLLANAPCSVSAESLIGI